MASVSAAKPAGSSWLDRLRVSRGFSAPSDLDLDRFLSAPETPSSPPPPSPPPPPPPPKKLSPPPLGLVAAALADLFVMGGPHTPHPRPLRKQPRPLPRARLPSPPSADNSVVAEEAKLARARARPKPLRRKRRSRGPASADLAACSRTEVTVIDTSAPGWKAEKLIFRRGTAWKVRDKKVWCAWRKKRRLGLVEKLGGDKGKEAPAGRDERQAALDEECTHNDQKDASKEGHDQAQLPRRRIKFSRSPRVPAAKDSSVYSLQAITTSSKYAPSCSRNKLKGK